MVSTFLLRSCCCCYCFSIRVDVLCTLYKPRVMMMRSFASCSIYIQAHTFSSRCVSLVPSEVFHLRKLGQFVISMLHGQCRSMSVNRAESSCWAILLVNPHAPSHSMLSPALSQISIRLGSIIRAQTIACLFDRST